MDDGSKNENYAKVDFSEKKVGRKWDNFPHISAQKKAAAATSAAV
jgi:hypothetical protein